MYQEESDSRKTPISGRPLALRARISGCASVTIYWCWTGITGTLIPTMRPVARAKLPVAETTCSQTMSPLSVATFHSPLGCGHDGMTVDLSPALARRPRQGLGQVGGLDIAVLGMLDRADDSVDVAKWPDLLDLLRRQELDRDAYRRRDAGVIAIF